MSVTARRVPRTPTESWAWFMVDVLDGVARRVTEDATPTEPRFRKVHAPDARLAIAMAKRQAKDEATSALDREQRHGIAETGGVMAPGSAAHSVAEHNYALFTEEGRCPTPGCPTPGVLITSLAGQDRVGQEPRLLARKRVLDVPTGEGEGVGTPASSGLAEQALAVASLRGRLDASITREREAAAELLAAVLTEIFPALAAIASRIEGLDEHGITSRGFELASTTEARVWIRVFVLENGQVASLSTTAKKTDYVVHTNLDEVIRYVDLDDAIGRLHRAFEQQLHGRAAVRAEQATERARYLEALVVLLERVAPGGG